MSDIKSFKIDKLVTMGTLPKSFSIQFCMICRNYYLIKEENKTRNNITLKHYSCAYCNQSNFDFKFPRHDTYKIQLTSDSAKLLSQLTLINEELKDCIDSSTRIIDERDELDELLTESLWVYSFTKYHKAFSSGQRNKGLKILQRHKENFTKDESEFHEKIKNYRDNCSSDK